MVNGYDEELWFANSLLKNGERFIQDTSVRRGKWEKVRSAYESSEILKSSLFKSPSLPDELTLKFSFVCSLKKGLPVSFFISVLL